MAKYRRVELNSLANYKLAERLLANGWEIISSNMFAIMFRKVQS